MIYFKLTNPELSLILMWEKSDTGAHASDVSLSCSNANTAVFPHPLPLQIMHGVTNKLSADLKRSCPWNQFG